MLSIPRDISEIIVEFVEDRDVARLQRVCKKIRVFSEKRMLRIKISIPGVEDVLRWLQVRYERGMPTRVSWWRNCCDEEYDNGEEEPIDCEHTPLLMRWNHRAETGGDSLDITDYRNIFYLDNGRLTCMGDYGHNLAEYCGHRERAYGPGSEVRESLPSNVIVDPQTVWNVLKMRNCSDVQALEVARKVGKDVIERLERWFVCSGRIVNVTDSYAEEEEQENERLLFRRRRDELRLAVYWALNSEEIQDDTYLDLGEYDDGDMDGREELDRDKDDSELRNDIIKCLEKWHRGRGMEWILGMKEREEERQRLPCDEEIIKWLERKIERKEDVRMAVWMRRYEDENGKWAKLVVETEISSGTTVYRAYEMAGNSLDVQMTSIPKGCRIEEMLKSRRVMGMIDVATLRKVMKENDDRDVSSPLMYYLCGVTSGAQIRLPIASSLDTLCTDDREISLEMVVEKLMLTRRDSLWLESMKTVGMLVYSWMGGGSKKDRLLRIEMNEMSVKRMMQYLGDVCVEL